MVRWSDEVLAGIGDVLAEFPPEVAQVLGRITVIAETTGDEFWGKWDGAVISLYRPAFDRMSPSEDRARQVRDVLRHEFEHAMGIVHPGHDDMRTGTSGVGVLALPDGRYAVLP